MTINLVEVQSNTRYRKVKVKTLHRYVFSKAGGKHIL